MYIRKTNNKYKKEKWWVMMNQTNKEDSLTLKVSYFMISKDKLMKQIDLFAVYIVWLFA